MTKVMDAWGEYSKRLGEVERTPDAVRADADLRELEAIKGSVSEAIDEYEKAVRADVRR